MNLFSKMLFLDGLMENIGTFFTDFGNSIFWSGILKFIGIFLYSLSVALFSVMDFLASFFRRIVGLDGGVSISGKQVTGDIVLSLIQSREVMNVFIALLVVAVFLLFVSTIVAIIKTEYNFDKGGNSKGPIFGRAIKALFYFLSVPTICVFGVWMANQLLSVLDQTTGGGGQNTHISSLVFAACCNNANRVANDSEFWNAYRQSENVSGAGGGRAFFILNVSLDGNDIKAEDKATRQKIALSINEAFKNETPFKQVYGSGGTSYDSLFKWSPTGQMGRPLNVTGATSGFKWHYGLSLDNVYANSNGTFSVYDINLVWFYYNMFSYDHLISLLACFLILKSLFDLCMGVVKRIYEMIVLFCVSPPIVALMPLDEGAAYKNWVKAFVGKTLATYGGVLAINFFYMLAPVLRTINVFNSVWFGIIDMTGVFNYFAQLIMIIAGAVSLSSISEMISKLIGADDAFKDGSAVGKSTIGAAASAIGFGIGAGKLMGKGVKTIANLPKNALNAGQQLGKDIKNIATGTGSGNAIENTTNDIADELNAGINITPNEGQAVGGGNAPSGGGSGGGGGSPSSGGGSGGKAFGDNVYDKAGKIAHITGNYLREGATAVGVGRAFMQTGKATGSMGKTTGKATGSMGKATGKATAGVAKSAAKSFGNMDKRKSFIKNVGHFAAGVAKSIATGATAVGMGLATAATAVGTGVATAATAVGTAARTAARGAGMTLRMGGAVLKNVAGPAAKSVAKGVGAVTGLVAGAATAGDSAQISNAVKSALPSSDARKARKDARVKRNARYDDEIQQSKLKQYKKEYKALQSRYAGKNSDMTNFYKDLESLQAKYKKKGLKKFD